MKKLLIYLEGVMPIFVALGIQIAVVGIVTLFCTIIAMIIGFMMNANGEATEGEVTGEVVLRLFQSQEIIYLLSMIGILVCGIVFFFWYHNIIRREARVNYHKVVTMKNAVLFILLGIGCQFFLSGLMTLIEPLFEKIFSDYAKTMENLFSGNIIIVVLLTVIVAPITEELIFRGVMLKKLRRTIPFLGANILQAAIFGIYHWNIVQGIYAFGMGLLLGYVTYKFKTILAPIVLHMIINASSFLMMVFPNSLPAYIILTVVGAALLVFSLFKMKVVDESNLVVKD